MTPSLIDSLAERTRHACLCDTPEKRARELVLCEKDPAWFVNRWGVTFDPQREPATIPFDLFPRQEELLRWLRERERLQESGIVEKSREVGVSFLCCAYALHRWLFRAGSVVCFASAKLELVDSRQNPKSLFHKLRTLLYHLPTWMLPKGFNEKDHDHEAKLINPANGAAVTGEGGDNIGRGGRATVYFVDEAAHLERPDLADRALSQTTRVRIDVSTPNGPGNPFARKRFSGRLPVFTLRWQDDLRKNQEWYEKEKARLIDPVLIAQELDLDYSASIEGICIPGAWVRAAVELDLPPSGPCVAGLDVAEEGPNVNALVGRRGPRVGAPRSWAKLNTTQTAHRAADECAALGVTRLSYDVSGVGAGVRGALASTERRLTFVPVAVNGGSTPTETMWPDGRTSKERFLNLRAELWWLVRTRFEKAYEYVTLGTAHPAADMISIPNHPQLIADLSLPRYFVTESGKVKLESKVEMRRRGVKSPDFGDALCYSFAPAPVEYGRPVAGGNRPDYAAGPARGRIQLPEGY